jgi:hypothetical protein
LVLIILDIYVSILNFIFVMLESLIVKRGEAKLSKIRRRENVFDWSHFDDKKISNLELIDSS